jgi:hypothetical protein
VRAGLGAPGHAQLILQGACEGACGGPVRLRWQELLARVHGVRAEAGEQCTAAGAEAAGGAAQKAAAGPSEGAEEGRGAAHEPLRLQDIPWPASTSCKP